MIYHVVTPGDWHAFPDRPYAPPSLAEEGFVHCSPDEATTLAVVNAFYRHVPEPLLVLCLDERRLTARVEREEPVPGPPAGAAEGTLFPHVYGPLDRAAVERILEVDRDEEGRARGLRERNPGSSRADGADAGRPSGPAD